MDARNDLTKLTPEKVRHILSEWFRIRNPIAVEFRDDSHPNNDTRDNYSIAYEAVFEPYSLDQSFVEVWVTSEGNIAIGFERRKRIAKRLGVKNKSNRFAAGHEPQCMNEYCLLTILDVIANGQISLSTTTFPFVGLISTKAVINQDLLQNLNSKGCSVYNWLKGLSKAELLKEEPLLHFQKWK